MLITGIVSLAREVGNLLARTDAPKRERSAQEQVATALVHLRSHSAARRKPTKKLMLATAVVAFMSTGTLAQTTVTTGAARSTVQIEPEARTKIKTYATEHKLRPVATRERIAVGAAVPSDVELVAVPSEWGPSLTRYRYFYSNDRVMLVDPANRMVVEEID